MPINSRRYNDLDGEIVDEELTANENSKLISTIGPKGRLRRVAQLYPAQYADPRRRELDAPWG